MQQQLLPNGASITIIHFTYETNGQWQIACMPNMREFHRTKFHKNYLRSNEPRAVTCPACKRSNVYVEAMGAINSNVK